MKRSQLLLSVAWLLHGAAWFLPVVSGVGRGQMDPPIRGGGLRHGGLRDMARSICRYRERSGTCKSERVNDAVLHCRLSVGGIARNSFASTYVRMGLCCGFPLPCALLSISSRYNLERTPIRLYFTIFSTVMSGTGAV